MKALFILLVVSTVIALVVLVAMWWRLRRHLRHPHPTMEHALGEIRADHKSARQG